LTDRPVWQAYNERYAYNNVNMSPIVAAEEGETITGLFPRFKAARRH